MKKFMNEFKAFALRGNVMSLAVGMIIGVAFQEIVSSLTDNILSPIIGLFMGGNFDAFELNIWGTTLRYGAFITSVFNFVILAFVVFIMVKSVNKLFCIKSSQAQVTRLCQFCKTVLHKDATRCPACTSVLDEEVKADV